MCENDDYSYKIVWQHILCYLSLSFQKAISMAVRDQGLQLWPNQMEKVKQLHSQLLVRHGVMLVGPTGGGKTAARNILQRALVLLPAITMAEEAATVATNIASRGPQLSPLPDGSSAPQRRPSVFSVSSGEYRYHRAYGCMRLIRPLLLLLL